MKLVAVSQRVEEFPERNETRDSLDQNLISLLLMADLIPVPVPNGLHEVSPDKQSDKNFLGSWLASVKPHGLVLSGGNDIGQRLDRDTTESRLLEYAGLNKLPVLGICRGMQMIANWSGAILHPVQGHVQTRHDLCGEIVGEVNSYHSFSLANCPDEFEVIARSEDGEIEAISHTSKAWQGWMWHPERETVFSVPDVRRIKALFFDSK